MRTAVARIAGIDEAGRGCLAGPVVAAAVVLGARPIEGLNDSKKLSPRKREALFGQIIECADDYGIGQASVEEIDRINILQATFLAMQRALAALRAPADQAWVDGNQAPKLPCAVRCIVDGDALEPAIMAASILAKVTRDRELVQLDARYPEYGFARHKGYGTALHQAALQQYGVTPIHRLSFAPCRLAAQQSPPGARAR
ncbi:ribonuclease HII [Sinimarinibacterium sp. NLF-5-8]|uniref:ribonuclease HII n=1 Tax=Sinimarinibacterium sp. NLF-5-8 TaxID=2698684 RepID=UPI00137BA49E|nr:ribonuclease HII [Sinimarinibacterium sp. NLF-5-8]